ncbi:MAG: glutamate--tRNA ligase, partial [Reyranellaceae bacterium]
GFGHFPLLTDAQGAGLSKRAGSLSLQELREQGIEPLAIAALLARLGTSDAIEPVSSLAPLVETIDFGHVGRAAARFSLDELRTLSARTVHGLAYGAVRERLAALDADLGEAFWLAVCGNLATVADAATWATIVRGPVEAVIEDASLLAAAARSLPPEPWDGGTWKAWTGAVGAATGKKGRALFHPLRLALTGREQGPEMAGMLPLIGRARVLSRLRGDVS